jgi:hypothetical protein
VSCRSRAVRLALVALICLAGAQTLVAAENPAPAELGGYLRIQNIGTFLEQCPDRDPNWATIKADFEIRRAGIPVRNLGCTEPISSLTAAQYSDEIIVAQGLRVMFYMDRGMAGHLPWTPGTLYDWMKTKVAGIDINEGGSWCCSIFNGRFYINVGAQDDFNRMFDKSWRGMSGNIGLYAHEARHVDGFPHSSCCGIPGGCDDTFNARNLSPYGIQWWLDNLWMTGTINVGYHCLTPGEIGLTNDWYLSGLNLQFGSRFCSSPPGAVALPALPGGACPEQRRLRPVRR